MKLRDAIAHNESYVGRNHVHDIKTDQIGRFFVVTRPMEYSELDDCWFETDVLGVANQVRGGLNENEIYGFYKTENAAKTIAQKLLQVAQKTNDFYIRRK